MTIYEEILVYPEGDTQEAPSQLVLNQIVDVNGSPLQLPLPTAKMIAYRVYRIAKNEIRGEHTTRYHLCLVRREEMYEYV